MKYTKQEFMAKTGIKQSRLSQLLRGYRHKGEKILPVLTPGKDYRETVFFESAIKKLTKK
jgi:hypothetical protein